MQIILILKNHIQKEIMHGKKKIDYIPNHT
jgi:hypothetical protein